MGKHYFLFADYEHHQQELIHNGLYKLNRDLIILMVKEQCGKDGGVRYGTLSEPFPNISEMKGVGDREVESLPVYGYDTPHTGGVPMREGPTYHDLLMVWGKDETGADKLYYLNDYLFDRHTEKVDEMSDEDFIKQTGGKRRTPVKADLEMQVDTINHVKELMQDGKLLYYPSAEAKLPKVIRYRFDPDLKANQLLDNVNVTDLNVEQIPAPKKPWFMGMGFLTDFVLFVSDSAKAKKATYEKDVEVFARYQNPDITAEMEKVGADVKKKYDRCYSKEQNALPFEPESDAFKRVEERTQKWNKFTNACDKRDLEVETGKNRGDQLDRIENGTGMNTLVYSCTLSAPFMQETQKEMAEAGFPIQKNMLFVANHITRDIMAKEPNREALKDSPIYGTKTGLDLIVQGTNVRDKAVQEYNNGHPKALAKHVENGLNSMCMMLKSASPEDFMKPNGLCEAAAAHILGAMKVVDEHPSLRRTMNLDKETWDMCRGWSEFAKVCGRSKSAQESMGKEHYDKSKFTPAKGYQDISAEKNLRLLCKNFAENKNVVDTAAQPQGKDLWSDALGRSAASLKNPSIPFIAALGKNPELIEQLKISPQPEFLELNAAERKPYIANKLSPMLQAHPIHTGDNPLWKKTVEQLASNVPAKAAPAKVESGKEKSSSGIEVG